jgi:hypothetical protein
MDSLVLKKLTNKRIWQRLLRERFNEPLHLNFLSLLVWLFGSYRAKIDHDLIVRHHNAFSILRCADHATRLGIKTVSLIEFGVAAGAGLINMTHIARRVSEMTGIQFKIYGFDTGSGMPPPHDYRDHPDMYQSGDFPMDVDRLRNALPSGTQLVIGDVEDTVPRFLAQLNPAEPLGYVVLDVDYYYSTGAALQVLADPDPAKYLPITLTYFDDIALDGHNSSCGQLLALNEFNHEHAMRRIERHSFLDAGRLYKSAPWLKHVYFLHVLDHPTRASPEHRTAARLLTNPYI